MRRPIACILVGGLLLAAAGCSDDATDGPPPTAAVVDCGLTQPQRGEAQAYAQVRVTLPGPEGRVRVAVRFIADGAGIGRGEATSIELGGGAMTLVNVVGADGATKVDTCEVAEVERI